MVKFTSKANLQTENESQSKDKLACSQAERLQIRQESCDKIKRLAFGAFSSASAGGVGMLV